jgi:hypothetical protein
VALVLTVVSFVFWSVLYLLAVSAHPYGDIEGGVFTDHFSHMNTARIFPSVGTRIWTEPLRDLGIPLTDDEVRGLPEDLRPGNGVTDPLFRIPGQSAAKPFVSSWSHQPRFHPPGDMVIAAPAAIVYQLTDLSFSGASRLVILTYLLGAHISIFFLIRASIAQTPVSPGAPAVPAGTTSRKAPAGPAPRSMLTSYPVQPIGLLVLFMVYLEAIHWSLNGFYEAMLIAPLAISAVELRRGRGAHSLFWFAIAANMHFRAYYFGPLAIWAAVIILRNREWRRWRTQEWVLIAAAAALSLVSLRVFAWLWPWFRADGNRNHLNITVSEVDWPAVGVFLIVMAIVAVALTLARSWWDLVIAGWFTVVFLVAREAFGWHVMTLAAWFLVPLGAQAVKHAHLVRDARIIAIVFIELYVFDEVTLLVPHWLSKFFP